MIMMPFSGVHKHDMNVHSLIIMNIITIYCPRQTIQNCANMQLQQKMWVHCKWYTVKRRT